MIMDIDVPVTSLSIGLLIGHFLGESEELKEMGVTAPYPVYVTDKNAKLPFLIYSRVASQQAAVKNVMGSDLVTVSVSCCAARYAECIEIGEEVRKVLEGTDKAVEIGGKRLYVKMILLADANEFWDNDLDCYCQGLQFTCKVWGNKS